MGGGGAVYAFHPTKLNSIKIESGKNVKNIWLECLFILCYFFLFTIWYYYFLCMYLWGFWGGLFFFFFLGGDSCYSPTTPPPPPPLHVHVGMPLVSVKKSFMSPNLLQNIWQIGTEWKIPRVIFNTLASLSISVKLSSTDVTSSFSLRL